jgi:hypothetical protein
MRVQVVGRSLWDAEVMVRGQHPGSRGLLFVSENVFYGLELLLFSLRRDQRY